MKRATLSTTIVCSMLTACRVGVGHTGSPEAGGLALVAPRDNTLQATAVPPADVAFVVAEGGTVEEAIAKTHDRADANIAPAGRRLLAKMPRVSERLGEALRYQRRLLLRQDPDRVYNVGDRVMTTTDFLQVVDRLLLDSSHTFVPEAIPVVSTGEVKFTAYFSPDLLASRVRTGPYQYPLLSAPADDSLRSLSRAALATVPDSVLRPNVLAWVTHPLDIYIMQLQGSGYVSYPDGTREYLGFQRSNGRPLTPIARALAQSDFDVPYRGIKAIRKWMSDDLPDRARVLNACANYVYFERGRKRPTGAGGVPLTSMVSVAADPTHYPLGAVLLAEIPKHNGVSHRETRILLVQDVGAAITGRRRLDLYTGVGAQAYDHARVTSHLGEVYILAPQRPSPPTAGGTSERIALL